MTWNHRIVKTENEDGELFELAEVFYDSVNLPYAYGNANIIAENMSGIQLQLKMFNSAMEKRVLNYPEDFTGDVNR